MRALAMVDSFGIENLQWIDRPVPAPGPGEVQVRMRAAALNYRDLQVLSGAREVPRPLIPLSDACAVVTEIGRRRNPVRRRRPSDAGLRARLASRPAAARRQLADAWRPPRRLGARGGNLARGRPRRGSGSALSDVEAATLPCAAVSAWNALFVATAVKPGDHVLIQGTGGVSLFALQFAKVAGARVSLISSSDEKLDRACDLGAETGVNYVAGRRLGRDGPAACGPPSMSWSRSGAVARWSSHSSAFATVDTSVSLAFCPAPSRVSIWANSVARASDCAAFASAIATVSKPCAVPIAQHPLRPVIDSVAPFCRGKGGACSLS